MRGLAGASDATAALVKRKFRVPVDLVTSSSRRSWFTKAVYAIGEKTGKEGKIDNGAEVGTRSRGGVGVVGSVPRLEGEDELKR
jgi:hypothetical protein